jgi:acyl-CoA thioesterase-1
MITEMSQLELVALVVRDYDAAIRFFVEVLQFDLVEDTPSLTNDGRPKRWVVVRPARAGTGTRTGILLAQADGDEQARVVGQQFAGRVGLFLRVDDFDAAYQRMQDAGVRFVSSPRQEPYGHVVVFLDLEGNRWDLLGPDPRHARASGDVRLCFIGDSFVNGTGDETALGWVGRVCAAAHVRGRHVTSYQLGIRRNTSLDVLGRWQQECECRLPAGGDGRLVLSFGANDTMIESGRQRVSTPDTCDAFHRIAEGAKDRSLPVLFVGPPPVVDDDHNERIARLDAALSREAHAAGVPYIELYAPLVNDARYRRDLLGGDGAHPSSIGYERIANHIIANPAWWFHSH